MLIFKANKFLFRMKRYAECSYCGSVEDCECESQIRAVNSVVNRTIAKRSDFPLYNQDYWFADGALGADSQALQLMKFWDTSNTRWIGRLSGALFEPYPYPSRDGGMVGDTVWVDGVYLRMRASSVAYDSGAVSPHFLRPEALDVDCTVMLMYCNTDRDVGQGAIGHDWAGVFQAPDGMTPINAFIRSDQRGEFQMIKRWTFNLRPYTFYTYSVASGQIQPEQRTTGLIGADVVDIVTAGVDVPDTGTFQQVIAQKKASWLHEEYVDCHNRRTVINNDPVSGYKVKKGNYFFAYTSTQPNNQLPPPVTLSHWPRLEVNMRFKYSDRKAI